MGAEIVSTASMPRLMYGTAWKKGKTADLVYAALKAGFTAVDTAAQPRHYDEQLAGKAIKQALSEGVIARQDLFIQTKFTPAEWQDADTIPYDPSLPLSERIHASVAHSLANLTTAEHAYIDCYVLHDPFPTTEENITFFEVAATYVPHTFRSLGVSNFSLAELRPILDAPSCPIKPCVVQNAFSTETGYDVALRRYLRAHGIRYQAFWTLTARPRLVDCAPTRRLAHDLELQGVREDLAVSAAVYALILGLGAGDCSNAVTIMDGTSNHAHMRGDLLGLEIWARWKDGEGRKRYDEILGEFKQLIGEDVEGDEHASR